MAEPGWYPDPDRTPGRLRWWDGRQWTTQTRPQGRQPTPPTSGAPAPRSSRWWLVVTAGVVLALLVAAAITVPRLVRAVTGGGGPSGPPSTQVCPLAPTWEAPSPVAAPGRVTSGRISVVNLGAPWTAPGPEPRVPYGHGFLRQAIPVDEDPPWVTSVQVGMIVAGDGFAGPRDGVHAIIECLLGDLYNGIPVTRHDVVDEAARVDGYDAWRLETDLTFDVPGLDFDRERFIILLIGLDDGTCAAFMADIPEPARIHEPDIRRAEKSLRIS